jgi:hypothetical protein
VQRSLETPMMPVGDHSNDDTVIVKDTQRLKWFTMLASSFEDNHHLAILIDIILDYSPPPIVGSFSRSLKPSSPSTNILYLIGNDSFGNFYINTTDGVYVSCHFDHTTHLKLSMYLIILFSSVCVYRSLMHEVIQLVILNRSHEQHVSVCIPLHRQHHQVERSINY